MYSPRPHQRSADKYRACIPHDLAAAKRELGVWRGTTGGGGIQRGRRPLPTYCSLCIVQMECPRVPWSALECPCLRSSEEAESHLLGIALCLFLLLLLIIILIIIIILSHSRPFCAVCALSSQPQPTGQPAPPWSGKRELLVARDMSGIGEDDSWNRWKSPYGSRLHSNHKTGSLPRKACSSLNRPQMPQIPQMMPLKYQTGTYIRIPIRYPYKEICRCGDVESGKASMLLIE